MWYLKARQEMEKYDLQITEISMFPLSTRKISESQLSAGAYCMHELTLVSSS